MVIDRHADGFSSEVLEVQSSKFWRSQSSKEVQVMREHVYYALVLVVVCTLSTSPEGNEQQLPHQVMKILLAESIPGIR